MLPTWERQSQIVSPPELSRTDIYPLHCSENCPVFDSTQFWFSLAFPGDYWKFSQKQLFVETNQNPWCIYTLKQWSSVFVLFLLSAQLLKHRDTSSTTTDSSKLAGDSLWQYFCYQMSGCTYFSFIDSLIHCQWFSASGNIHFRGLLTALWL